MPQDRMRLKSNEDVSHVLDEKPDGDAGAAGRRQVDTHDESYGCFGRVRSP